MKNLLKTALMAMALPCFSSYGRLRVCLSEDAVQEGIRIFSARLATNEETQLMREREECESELGFFQILLFDANCDEYKMPSGRVIFPEKTFYDDERYGYWLTLIEEGNIWPRFIPARCYTDHN